MHRNYLQLAVLVFSVLLICACNQQRVYYVSSSGNDDAAGTENDPLRTIETVNKLDLKPGDQVLFKGGDTFEGTLSLTLNGTDNSRIVLGSYGAGMAVLSGRDSDAVILKGAHFLMHSLLAKGSGRKNGNTTNGITVVGATNFTINNVKTTGFQKSGLELFNCMRATVVNVHAFENGFSGIHIVGEGLDKSKRILLQDCFAENNPGDPTAMGNHSGNGILIAMSDSVTVDRCKATNNGWDMPRVGNGPVGIWAYESEHIVIQYCISYRNRTAKGAKDGGGFDFDGGVKNSIIQYCLSYENDGAGYGLFQYNGASPWHDNIVRYCISLNDGVATEGSGGIFIWNGSADSTQMSDCVVHNNLMYSQNVAAVEFEPASLHRKFLFANNIFIGRGDVVNGPSSGEKFFGNDWWNTGEPITFRGYQTLKEWSNASGQEIFQGKFVGHQVDPMFRGPMSIDLTDPHQLITLENFRLPASSPLRDAGLSFEALGISLPANDFYETPLDKSSVPDLGIHEAK